MLVVPPIMVLLAKSPLVDQYDISCVEEIVAGAAPLSAELEQEVTSRLGDHVCIRQGRPTAIQTHVILILEPYSTLALYIAIYRPILKLLVFPSW